MVETAAMIRQSGSDVLMAETREATQRSAKEVKDDWIVESVIPAEA